LPAIQLLELSPRSVFISERAAAVSVVPSFVGKVRRVALKVPITRLFSALAEIGYFNANVRPIRESPAMVVGVLRLTLFLPENHSLKGKRQVLRAIKDRVRNKFNVSIAESDGHDMWQRAELGICQVGSDRAFVDSALREVVNFIDSLGLAPLGEEELEILNY
jgi:uncharacterized protein YlxP (DUF503 family)